MSVFNDGRSLGSKAWERLLDDLALGKFPTPADVKIAKATLRELVADYNRLHERAPEPLPAPPPNIFAQPGWMAVRFESLPSADELAHAGIRWIAAPLSHGANADRSHAIDADDRANEAWLAAGHALSYRERGIKVGGWIWNQGFHGDVESVIATMHCVRYKLDLFIANGEEAWKRTTGPEIFASALEFNLRSAGITPQIAWSVLGAAHAPWIFPFDYKAFTSRGWRILPQSYPQDSPDYALERVLDHAEQAGIPKTHVHPTIANFPARVGREGAYRPTIAEWEALLRHARERGYHGFSVWAHDFLVGDVARLVTAARS